MKGHNPYNYDNVPRLYKQVWEFMDRGRGKWGLHEQGRPQQEGDAAEILVGASSGNLWAFTAETSSGVLRVEAFDGLWLDESALVFTDSYTDFDTAMAVVMRWVIQGVI